MCITCFCYTVSFSIPILSIVFPPPSGAPPCIHIQVNEDRQGRLQLCLAMPKYGPLTEAETKRNNRQEAELAGVQYRSLLITLRRVAMVASALPLEVRLLVSMYSCSGYGFICAQRHESSRQFRWLVIALPMLFSIWFIIQNIQNIQNI